jgi:hypothetical protein
MREGEQKKPFFFFVDVFMEYDYFFRLGMI